MANFKEDVVTALYDYNSQDKEELSIYKNEQLELLDASCAWWKVKNSNGSVGLVPSNYLKRERAKAESLVNRLANRIPGGRKTRFTSNFGLDTRTTVKPGGLNTPMSIMNQVNEKYTCKFEYTASKSDELSLVEGMHVVVTKKEDDGWWYGKSMDGFEGWFPANYVSEISETDSNKIVNINPSHQQSTGPVKTILCLYSYTARYPEELSFEENELLDVVEEPTSDPEWLSARNSKGAVGLVPKNYVKEDSSKSQQEPSNYDQVSVLKSDSNNSISKPRTNNDLSGQLPVQTSTNCSTKNPDNDKSWFFGSMKRTDAEKMLASRAQVGEYLVRNSESSKANLSISMKAPGKLRHFQVLILSDGQFGIGQKRFPSMEALLHHYTTSPIFCNKELGNAYLSRPLPR